MIVLGILDLIFGVITALFTTLNLPSFTTAQINFLHDGIDSIMQGVSVLAYFGGNQIFTFFFIIMGVEAVYRIYTLIMWIIRKIPVSTD